MRFLPPLLILLLAADASASAAPRCTPSEEGAVACLDGKLCECRHDPGGSLTGRRAGSRLDCGVLRPACGATALPPPDAGGQQPPPPMPFLPIPPSPMLPPSGWR